MLKPKKSLGQHWLRDVNILSEIIAIAEVKTGENILEIGPGPGTLTEMLLEHQANVTAVEIDTEIYQKLKKITEGKARLKLVNDDILKFDLRRLPASYKVVANIPYYLTSNLIRLLSESANPPASVTLLVQKEVAERICAAPGQMSILSVSAQFYYDCKLGIIVPADKFSPPPKVDSQVVHMARKADKTNQDVVVKQFFRVVKAGFSSRRKTLLNSLSGGLDLSKGRIQEVLQSCQINPATRPQELSLEQWKKLSKELA